jgi:hypothetical protein
MKGDAPSFLGCQMAPCGNGEKIGNAEYRFRIEQFLPNGRFIAVSVIFSSRQASAIPLFYLAIT